jgi:hypothetical protein
MEQKQTMPTDMPPQAWGVIKQHLGGGLQFRAYQVRAMGKFQALNDYAKSMEGTAYLYDDDWPDGSWEAIVALPLGVELIPGQRLKMEGRYFKTISAWWISPP